MGLLLRSVGDKALRAVAWGSTPHTEGLIFPFADRASFSGVYRNEARQISGFFSAGIMVKVKVHDWRETGNGMSQPRHHGDYARRRVHVTGHAVPTCYVFDVCLSN